MSNPSSLHLANPAPADSQSAGTAAALLALGRALLKSGYHFVTPTPETHRRVNARPGNERARSLTDVFGWSRPFPDTLLPAELLELAGSAGIIARDAAGMHMSRLRFSNLDGMLFAHSAYPTNAADAVFFGPDTYRFASFISRILDRNAGSIRRILDVGCGSGAGGLAAARRVGGDTFTLLTDINPDALRLARANARLAGIRAAYLCADLLTAFPSQRGRGFDLIVANPPYLVDPGHRLYRDGGGSLGFDLSLRILRESLPHLAPGGRLLLYTGSAIIGGQDAFKAAATAFLATPRHPQFFTYEYAEIDPDVFGEELKAGPYREADRIAAVSLVVTACARA